MSGRREEKGGERKCCPGKGDNSNSLALAERAERIRKGEARAMYGRLDC